jgi:hypothetical protein
MLAGQRDAIGALVAAFAMPFPPVPTLAADLAVPGAAILNDVSPAKRVPVHLAAPLAGIVVEQLPKRNALTPARQLIFLYQLFLRQLSELFDIPDGANRKRVNVHAVQGVVTVGTGAVFVTRLVVPETDAASVPAAGFAVAV